MEQNKPLVGVSQCLLGHPVRYDGKSKANKIVLQQLSDLFELVPVCPEVEAGLGIPRPAVQLTGNINSPRLTGRDDPSIDVTQVMYDYCKQRPAELNKLKGFIFKSRSPSCGLNSTPVFVNNECISETASGIFTDSLCRTYPELIIIEDTHLSNKKTLNDFINRLLLNEN